MTPMRKEDMIGLFIYPFPGNLLFLPQELPDLLFFRVFCNRFFVTFQAGLDRWKPREGLFLKVRVAGNTLHPLLYMLLVVEQDRLSGS
jgi:hypothetical protein